MASSGRPPTPGLTPRQLEVLSLMMEGYETKEMADKLGIAERNIKLHVSDMKSRTRSNNRVTLAIWAITSGTWVPPTKD